ncbi:MAG: TlpA family protein disulfide reductase [Muribaculaceae bacterium]|nr:TlpA family protein disulfide reductase [Muribaculaceae bacterium]
MLISAILVNAKKNDEVWLNPDASQNIETYFPGLRVNVSLVEFKPDETIVRLHMRTLRPNMTYNIPSSTVIRTDEKEYALRSVEGHELDVPFNPSIYSGDSLVLHFEPLPKGCKSFDLLTGDKPTNTRIIGITPHTTNLDESCWRNEKTGDWEIGFFPEGVVYDSRLWSYISRDHQAGKYVVTDGKDKLTIEVGKEKNGKRSFNIGEQSPVSLSRIIGNTLPAYPNKEYKRAFDDSKYQKNETVNISGLVRGLPEIVAQHRGKDINIYYNNIFTGRQEKISTEMDSLGRFSFTFPIPNTTHIILDTKSNNLSFPVEQGKEYFVLEDYAGQKRLIMGDDVRVQNEIVVYSFPFLTPRMEEPNDDYIGTVDRWLQEIDVAIDDIARNYPTLSDLYIDYMHKNAMLEMAFALEQSRSKYPASTFPPEIENYILENYWSKLPENVNAYSECSTSFINSFIEDVHTKSYSLPFKMENGKTAFLTVPADLANTLGDDIRIIRGDNDDAESIPEDSVKNAFNRISIKVREFLDEKGHDYWHLSRMKEYESILKSLYATAEISDIFMSKFYDEVIKTEMTPLSVEMEAKIDSVFSGQAFKDFVRQNNDRYKALVSSGNKSEIDINSGKEMKDLSDGEILFRKIIEPYKGKPVLIDVWGTWCGPCREAMKDFAEERDVLAPFDVVFVFLANNSKDDAIKVIVEEYGIVGENVVHYNFPVEQQKALERFLKVKAYPSYRLVSCEGNLIDVDVDARNLESLMKLLNVSGLYQ